MSGLEVIGVVLGGIPLVISGLEHYADGADTIKRAFRAGTEFRTVSRKLDAEKVIFRNTLDILLNDCIDIEMQKTLMDDVGGREWQRPEVEEALKLRLQTSYLSYVEHVKNIEQSILKFKERLHMNDDGKVPFDNPHSFRQAYKRLHFAMKKERYLDLIGDIRSDNTHLDRLTHQTKALQTERRARKVPDFDKIRSSATSVYQTLKQGLQVSCGASHKVSICLRNSPTDSGSSAVARPSGGDDAFRIVLRHDVNPKQAALPWSLEEAEIRLIDAIASSASAVAALSVSASPLACGATKKTVQFQAAGSSSISQSKSTPVAPQSQEIHDLCHSIQGLRSTQCGICLGYMKCISSQHRHELYWPERRLLDQASLSVGTLDSILERKAHSSVRFTNADARKLAVPLALGMLRLHDTPWLEQSWCAKDVTLMSQSGKILADYPFFSQSMTAGTQPAIKPHNQSSLAASMIRNQTLFALGIILVELCMGKAMNELHVPRELNADGTKHDLSDFLTATRLVDMEEISDTFGKRFSEVVRRCVRCDLNQSKTSLEDVAFRKAVYNEVLAELEEDHKQFFNLA